MTPAEREICTRIRTCGVPLHDHGVHEFALRKQDALEIVEALRAAQIPVLGGDVWLLTATDAEPTLDSWYSDPPKAESRAAYAERSAIESLTYINSYPLTAERMFVLVADLPAYVFSPPTD